jgi:hypothetical protein
VYTAAPKSKNKTNSWRSFVEHVMSTGMLDMKITKLLKQAKKLMNVEDVSI